MNQLASGLRGWALQRVSALYLGGFTLYLLWLFLFNAPTDVAAWRAQVSGPISSLAWMLAFLALILHAWVGLRDILIDYLHPPIPRITGLLLAGLFLIVCSLWALRLLILVPVMPGG